MVRLIVHMFRGLYICARHFPRHDEAWQARTISRWSRQLLLILGIRVHPIDRPSEWPPVCVLVTNHISWIDPFVILAEAPAVLVAKAEIRGWPLIGRLVAQVGTLFIERAKKSHARITNERIVQTIKRGRVIVFFPEGTTTEGDRLLKFHGALFQPSIDAAATIVPATIRYRDQHGARSNAPAYVNEISLLKSVWSIVSEPHMTVDLTFGSTVNAAEYDRRTLAVLLHGAMSASLGFSDPATDPRPVPETPRDHQAVTP